jgi:Cu+-exporting ATPase
MKSFKPVGKEFKVDPVCGMKVDPVNPPFRVRYKGEPHYFCSEVCKHLFERVPEKYIQPTRK